MPPIRKLTPEELAKAQKEQAARDKDAERKQKQRDERRRADLHQSKLLEQSEINRSNIAGRRRSAPTNVKTDTIVPDAEAQRRERERLADLDQRRGDIRGGRGSRNPRQYRDNTKDEND